MLTPEERRTRIDKIRHFPTALEKALHGVSEAQLDAIPDPQSWSARQIVHHLADSHMNAFIRFKLLLSEDHPTIRPYDQNVWAKLPDAENAPLETSLTILRGLHGRWAVLLDAIKDDQWSRTGFHPESGEISLNSLLITYSNHCDAHLDQMAEAFKALA